MLLGFESIAMNLALRDTVFGCISNGRAAFIDLETSSYFGAPEHLEQLLQKVVRQDELDADDLHQLKDLIDEGLLVETPTDDTKTSKLALPICELGHATFKLHGWEIALACVSQIQAATILKFQRLDQIFRSLKQASAQKRGQDAISNTLMQRAAMALRASEIIISSNDKCLRRSLALIIYLSHFRISAKLVIAVKMRPFGAHAWAQFDDTVLNDALDNIRAFTPILVV